MTNQLQARRIALFYCNASFEPQKDHTHATVDHDSIVPTLYGIVMVNFTLVTLLHAQYPSSIHHPLATKYNFDFVLSVFYLSAIFISLPVCLTKLLILFCLHQ